MGLLIRLYRRQPPVLWLDLKGNLSWMHFGKMLLHSDLVVPNFDDEVKIVRSPPAAAVVVAVA